MNSNPQHDRKIVLNFYRSYYDVMMSLSKRNRLEFIEYVLKVSFFDATLELKPFNNDKLNNAFCIIYGQLLKQQRGYINGYGSKRSDLPTRKNKTKTKIKTKTKTKNNTYRGKDQPLRVDKDRDKEQVSESVEEWINYRKQIKKSLSEASIKKLIKDEASNPKEFKAKVEFSIANGYQGLFAPKQQKENKEDDWSRYAR